MLECMMEKTYERLTGEPYDGKLSCTVRGGSVAKVPHDGNSVALYPSGKVPLDGNSLGVYPTSMPIVV